MEDYKKKYEEALSRAKVINPGTTDYNIVTEIFPELKENEYDRIRKEIIDYLKGFIPHHDDNLVAKSKVWISWLENQGEQKPTDKVKSKFKVGDWVVTPDNEVKQIEKVGFGNYYFTDNTLYNIIDTDNEGHLWTIQDAKDGDVLANNGNIILFKEISNSARKDYKYIKSHCLALIHTFDFYTGGSYNLDDEFHPATKEQQDHLFKKMKEAGYEWDAEKKELKKIEQEQTELPNGEDFGIDSLYHAARILEKTLGEVEGYQSDDGILEHKCAIEAVNRLYKQKTTWSEEDEKLLNLSLENLIELKNRFGEKYGKVGDCIVWLKSIKERMKGE